MGADDSDLIERIRSRDPQAMGAFYDRYGQAAYNLIIRIVNDPSVAEDVLAETFIKAWNRLGGLRGNRVSDLGLWILCLARNAALDHMRSGKALGLNTLESLLLFQDTARDRTPSHWHALRDAVSTLSARERQALELACFDGLSPGEMSLRLERPLPEIRGWLAAALAKLTAVR